MRAGANQPTAAQQPTPSGCTCCLVQVALAQEHQQPLLNLLIRHRRGLRRLLLFWSCCFGLWLHIISVLCGLNHCNRLSGDVVEFIHGVFAGRFFRAE